MTEIGVYEYIMRSRDKSCFVIDTLNGLLSTGAQDRF